MPKVWKVSWRHTEPEEVECEVPGYPNRDPAGDIMYENSHYSAPESAWDWLMRDVAAHQSLLARHIKETQDRLRELEKELALSVVRRAKIDEGRAEFLEKRGRHGEE